MKLPVTLLAASAALITMALPYHAPTSEILARTAIVNRPRFSGVGCGLTRFHHA